jgi:hypothetical protein
LIEFNADELESALDVVFSGDMGTVDDGPFKFSSATGRLRVGLEFDAPLTRLSERNNYRQALIEFQQARRSYYAFRDQISQGLRNVIRNLELNQRNFEIRRNAVRVADLQIEVNEDIRRLQEASGTSSGPTAARDAIQALDDLLRAQNDFLSVWVTYEVLRRTLDFNLGTMELDMQGMWIDPGPMGPEQGYPGIGDDSDCWPGPLVMPSSDSLGDGTSVPGGGVLEAVPPGISEPAYDLPLAPPDAASNDNGDEAGNRSSDDQPLNAITRMPVGVMPDPSTGDQDALDAADADAGFEVILSDQQAPNLPPPAMPLDGSLENPSAPKHPPQYGLPLQAPSQDP